MARVPWGAAWTMLAALRSGAASGQEPDDHHVALRARAGLPAASAVGEVRIYRLALYLGGQGSTVARRDPRGRWTVSTVETWPRAPSGVRVTRRKLSRKSAEALEGRLDDPALYLASGSIGEEVCLDPGVLEAEVTWKGRSARLSANCESDDFLEGLSGLLGAR